MFSVQAVSYNSRKHIYIDVFRFKKNAIECYNYLKNEVDEYAAKHGYRTTEELTHINKTGQYFKIGYICIDQNNFLLFMLELYNVSNSGFREFIENNYCEINGKIIPYYIYEEQVWRSEFPNLFTSNISVPLIVK